MIQLKKFNSSSSNLWEYGVRIYDYRANQAREPKGTPEGGQFAEESSQGVRNGKGSRGVSEHQSRPVTVSEEYVSINDLGLPEETPPISDKYASMIKKRFPDYDDTGDTDGRPPYDRAGDLAEAILKTHNPDITDSDIKSVRDSLDSLYKYTRGKDADGEEYYAAIR